MWRRIRPTSHGPKKENKNMSSANNVSHAVDHVKDAASTVHESLLDLGVQAKNLVRSARSQRVRAIDAALQQLGLQRRESAFRPAMFFVAGAVVAGAVALVLAPTSGKKLKTKIVDLLEAAKGGGGASAGSQDMTTTGQGAPFGTSMSDNGAGGRS
jgi:hypothetical protein